MSAWDAYIDNIISRGKGNIDKACIIGLKAENRSNWTPSNGTGKHIDISQNEVLKVSVAIAEKRFSDLLQNGLYLEGNKYRTLKATDDEILGKLKGSGSVTMMPSLSCIVIAHVPEDKQQGAANDAVFQIVEYLKSVGI